MKASPICRPAPSNNDENDKFTSKSCLPQWCISASVTLVSCSPSVDVKILVQTSGGDRQGGPEDLKRKFASNGSSPRHLCIEQALNLADRYHCVGGASTCGCIPTVFAGIGHPCASLSTPSHILVNHPLLFRFEDAVPVCNAA